MGIKDCVQLNKAVKQVNEWMNEWKSQHVARLSGMAMTESGSPGSSAKRTTLHVRSYWISILFAPEIMQLE